MIQNLFCFFVQEFQYETRKSNGKSGNRKSLKWFNPSIWYYSFSCCKFAVSLQAICLSGRLKILYQPTTSNCLGHVKANDDEIVGDSFPTDQSFQVGYFSPIPSVPLLIESIDHNSGWPVTFIFIEESRNIVRSFSRILSTWAISTTTSPFGNFFKPISLELSSASNDDTTYEENISKRIFKSVKLVPFQLYKYKMIILKCFETPLAEKLTGHKL